MSGWYLALLWLLCAAVFLSDWLFRRVPNLLLIAVALGYLAARFADWSGLPVGTTIDWSDSLVGAVLAFVFLLPFYAFRAMGAGDVKCFAVMGLLMGPAGAAGVWLIGTALTGVHAIVQLACASHAVPGVASLGRAMDGDGARLQRLAAWVRDKRQGRRGIPYAAYMAIAAVSQSYWFNARL